MRAARTTNGCATLTRPGTTCSPSVSSSRPSSLPLEALLVSIGVVALAKIADKTQIATVAPAARFDWLAAVVLGTTVRMLLANAPVAFFGEALAKRLPVRVVHVVAALVIATLGAGVLTTG